MSKYSEEELKAAVNELNRLLNDPIVSAAYEKEREEIMDKALMEAKFTKEGKILGQALELAERKVYGITKRDKEIIISFHKNGVSDDIICSSLNITPEKLEHILKEEN